MGMLGPKTGSALVAIGAASAIGLTTMGFHKVIHTLNDTAQKEAAGFIARMPERVQGLIQGKPYKDAKGNVYFTTVDGHQVRCYDHSSSPSGNCTHPGFKTVSGPPEELKGPTRRAISVALRTDHLGLVLDEFRK